MLRWCYLVLTILILLVVTLLPSESGGPLDWDEVFCLLCGRASTADGLANILLFVPFGVALGLVGYAPRRALLFGAGLSLSVELAQLVVPGRDPSLSDLIFNTLGAVLGSYGIRVAPKWMCPGVDVASRLSAVSAIVAAAAFVLTDVLLAVSLPETAYFGGSASMQRSQQPLRIGGNTEPRGYFQGRIDEVRVYRRALTPSEIRSDMNTPVAAAPRSAELMAAYGFDEGGGLALTDRSGHGNMGQIVGATWTTGGRFGGALVFDGRRDVVVIPHSPSLDLTLAMTLEAWVYPTAAQTGWRAILQKEFDTYFLFASSRAGPLRPGGGGTFGLLTDTMTAPRVVPTNAWTHVAVTYDGAVLELYIDGRLVGRRLRWYPGPIVEATVDGLPIAAGLSTESPQLRAGLLAGAPLRVRTVASSPVPIQAPLVTLHDASRNEILLLAADGDDVVFRLRTRAAAAELDSPAIRAPGVLRGLPPGGDVAVTVSRDRRGYCIDVNSHPTCGLGYTLGMGWTFLVYRQIPPGWPHRVLNALWLAALFLPFGFWARRRWESLVGLLVLAAGVVLPSTLGNLNATTGDVGAGIAGIVMGWACARWVAHLGSCAERGVPGHRGK